MYLCKLAQVIVADAVCVEVVFEEGFHVYHGVSPLCL
jgi:hypothetical protein